MLELAQRLGLDLADALAGDQELLANFFQRMVGIQADADCQRRGIVINLPNGPSCLNCRGRSARLEKFGTPFGREGKPQGCRARYANLGLRKT